MISNGTILLYAGWMYLHDHSPMMAGNESILC